MLRIEALVAEFSTRLELLLRAHDLVPRVRPEIRRAVRTHYQRAEGKRDAAVKHEHAVLLVELRDGTRDDDVHVPFIAPLVLLELERDGMPPK